MQPGARTLLNCQGQPIVLTPGDSISPFLKPQLLIPAFSLRHGNTYISYEQQVARSSKDAMECSVICLILTLMAMSRGWLFSTGAVRRQLKNCACIWINLHSAVTCVKWRVCGKMQSEGAESGKAGGEAETPEKRTLLRPFVYLTSIESPLLPAAFFDI